MSIYRNFTLAADILYVNKIAFMAFISVSIKFITLNRIINRKSKTIEAALIRIKKLYSLRGFILSVAEMYNKFELPHTGLSKQRILLSCSANNWHAP